MSNPGIAALIAWWKLEESSGIRYDAQMNVNLAQSGGVGYYTGHQTFTGNCADFVAPNSEYLYTTDPTNVLRGGDFPIAIGLWIKPHYIKTNSKLVSKWNDTDKEYVIYIEGSKIRFAIFDANNTMYWVQADTFGTLSNSIWYFVGAFFDSVTNKIYVGVNNIWNVVNVGIYGIDATDADFTVGVRGSLTQFYDGLMDEVFFYKNKVLTWNEWAWLYNSGYGRRHEDVAQVTPPSVDVAIERKMPEIYVYDQALAFLGIIEDYSSLNWAERYNSEGDFELELPLSYAPSSLLNFGNFLYIGTSDKLMIVEEKKPTSSPTEGKLIVNGRSAESILRRRILMQIDTWFAPAEFIAYYCVYWSSIMGAGYQKRKIDLFEDGTNDTWPPAMESSAVISEQFDNESIYEIIETVLKKVDLGFKIIVAGVGLPSPKLYFLVYAGRDRSSNPVIFSDKFDNLLDSSFLTTQKTNINATLVVTKDDPTYEMMFVWKDGSDRNPGGTEPSGLNRFESRLETSIDRREKEEVISTPPSPPITNPTLGIAGKVALIAIGITTTPIVGPKSEPPAPLTNKEVLAIIEERGEIVVKDNLPVGIFDGDVDARGQFVIEQHFFLGDIVLVDAHGINDKARVVEVVKSYSFEGEKIYIAFDFEV